MSDEFEGNSLDGTKWFPYNPHWKGRQPGLFYPPNVVVHNGSLQLTARSENVSGEPVGFGNFTTAAVQSKVFQRYGYFEVRAQAMNSRASSSFWFSADGTSEEHERTEIDVFKLCGGEDCLAKLRSRYNMNLHSFIHPLPQCNGTKGTLNNHTDVTRPFLFSADYHVMGLLWEKQYIVWTLDGQVVRNTTNHCFDQALRMDFDSETMPDWMGLPDPKTLPSTFYVDYVRAWQHPPGYYNHEGSVPVDVNWPSGQKDHKYNGKWRPDIFGDFIKGSLGV